MADKHKAKFNAQRIALLILIYILAGVGWSILGSSTKLRSDFFNDKLADDVAALWGKPQLQMPPIFQRQYANEPHPSPLLPASNAVDVDIQLEHRRKGLIWYPVFKSSFAAEYELHNPSAQTMKTSFNFSFPDPEATYDKFALQVDGETVEHNVSVQDGVSGELTIEGQQSKTIRIAYTTRGMTSWRYLPSGNHGRVRNLKVRIQTNFANVDFPSDAISPDQLETESGNANMLWDAGDLISNKSIGVIMPVKLNPGPLSTRMTFFAPVCLLFFFLLLAGITIIKDIYIHPMQYLFTAAGFFAFHLLFAYLVDHINVHLSFTISAVTSVTLVNYYLKASLGRHFPMLVSFLGQVFYLILFSYSFFLRGMTGLTVAVGSVLTLAVFMVMTAKTDWDDVFGSTKPAPPPLPVNV